MLHQIILPSTIILSVGNERTHRIKLVITRKDQLILTPVALMRNELDETM